MAITAQMVKDLREKTGAGMMDCKKALEETGGDAEKAVDWLRQKGMAKAAKKAGRATSEGLVTAASSPCGRTVALVAVRCETDFVARGEQFRDFAQSVAQLVLEQNPANARELRMLMGNRLEEQIAIVGENMTVGDFARFEAEGNEAIGRYVHANNKVGALVKFSLGREDTAGQSAFADLAKNVAMQVVAASPLAVSPDRLKADVVEREREIYRQKALDEGKPANIVDKIVEGAVKKFYKEVCLLEQPYIRDDKKAISDVLNEAGKELGDTVNVACFARVQLAE